MKLPWNNRWSTVLARSKPYAIPLLLSSCLAYFAVSGILAKAGRPALPLDDSFIHLQFARRFAEGHPFTFTEGGGFSSGATSFLWPLLIVPFSLFGMSGHTLVWSVWILGTLFHAALVLETYRLAEPLAGKPAAVAAAAMSLLFGAFTWFAWSGMETVPLTWALVRAFRLGSDHVTTVDPSPRASIHVACFALVPPLLRPEGGLAALAIAFALLYRPPTLRGRRSFGRALALLPLVGIAWIPFMNFVLTGHARSTTAMVKWYVGNPYYPFPELVGAVANSIRMLVTELLAGGPYTAIFLPEKTHLFLAASIVLLVALTRTKSDVLRGGLLLVFVLGTLIPCTFLTILWNRVRYIWPFAPAWFVLLACGAARLESLSTRFLKTTVPLGVLIAGLYAGMLATKLAWSLDDLATSARAIDQQQVTLGEWAHDNLPEDARIGVNDTGAIAYFSERQTFDVVGLTTESEAPYWVAGPGSRYEHYEKLGVDKLPTHFIVYPGWMGIRSVLGEELTSATVIEQSILGGATKVAYRARYDVLGRAALPDDPKWAGLSLVDELDVSDLESEALHRYWLGRTFETENHAFVTYDELGEERVDGGRTNRAMDRFEAHIPENTRTKLVMRLGAEGDVPLVIEVDGESLGEVPLGEGSFLERDLVIPASPKTIRTVVISAPEGSTFTSMHYWFFRN